MKRILSLLLTFVMVIGIFAITPISVEASAETDRVTNQIKSTYTKAKSLSGRTNFSNVCTTYVKYQLIALGVTSSSDSDIKGNGNQVYNNIKEGTTSTGYTKKKYSGNNCLNNILSANSGNVYNIVVSWTYQYGYSNSNPGAGHVLFIHAIIDNTVYFSDNYTYSGKAEGSPLIMSLSTFMSKWNGMYGNAIGAVHFTNSTPAIISPTLSVDVSKGYAQFKWNYQSSAKYYALKIWKDKLRQGDPCCLIENIPGNTTSQKVNLPPAYYEGYVDIIDANGNYLMSNIVKFTILTNPPNVSVDVSSGDAVFSWNYQDNIKSYTLKIWQGTLWDGDAHYIDQDIMPNTTSQTVKLAPGSYEAYIDAIDTNDNFTMSNVVSFTISLVPPKVTVDVSNGDVFLHWNSQSNAKYYDIKIWKDELRKGDVNCRVQYIPASVTSYELNFAPGYYEGYIDVMDENGNYLMSNVIKFTVARKLGDVDGDNDISIMDATLIQRHSAKQITLTDEQQKYADTDKDGKTSVMDATAIQRFIAKIITEF